MDIDWQSHREALEELYLTRNMSLDQVCVEMENRHKFKASKNQYVKQFKVWNWSKNLTKEEWKDIGKAISIRKKEGRETEVWFNGVQISDAKVKKEVSRHLLPSFELIHKAPQFDESDRIQLRTPPPMNFANNSDPPSMSSSPLVQKKRKHDIRYEVEPSNSKIQRTLVRHFHNRTTQCNQQQLNAHLPILQQKTLPYLEFVEFLDSFKSLTEPLLQGPFFDAPSPSISPFIPVFPHDIPKSEYLLDDNYYDFCSETSTEISKQQNLGIFYQSFANILIPLGGAPSQDQLDANMTLQRRLPVLLENMPEKEIGEHMSNMELLLGPPSFSAALCLLKTVVYLYSNNIINGYHHKSDSILEWVVETIPFQNLSVVLRTKLPTLLQFQRDLFLFGVETSRTSFVKALVELDVKIKELMVSSDLALEKAIGSGSAEMVKFVLNFYRITSFGPNLIDYLDMKKISVEIAQVLVSAGVLVHKLAWLGFKSAIEYNDINLARYLINVAADFDKDHQLFKWEYNSERPLRLAVRRNRAEIVNLLLQSGADVNAVSFNTTEEDSLGFRNPHACFPTTALQAAAFEGRTAIVTALLRAKSNVNERAHGRHGQTALYAATSAGHCHIVELLLHSGADVNLPGTSSNKNPHTALLAAIYRNDPALVRLLLKFGANPNVPVVTCYGTTVLEAARGQKNHANIISMLLNAKAENTIPVNNALSARHFELALLHNVRVGDMEKLYELVGRGAQINLKRIKWDDRSLPVKRQDLRGTMKTGTILHWAIFFDTVDSSMFRYLVERAVTSGERVINGDIAPALHEAVRRRRFDLLEILLDAGIDINARANSSKTNFDAGNPALHVAIINQDVEMVSWLLDRHADINLKGYNWTPLRRALMPLYPNIFRLFVCNRDIVKLILSRGADINIRETEALWHRGSRFHCLNLEGLTTFQLAVLRASKGNPCDTAIVHHFLDLKVNVNEPPSEPNGRTALQLASAFGNMGLVLFLLDHGADVNAPTSEQGLTALQSAAIRGHIAVVQLLLARGADVNDPTSKNGLTALQSAVEGGHIAVVQLLLARGAEVNHYGSKADCSTALQLAAQNGHIKIAQILIAWGADVNAQNLRSTLTIAARFGRLDMVQLLINEGADCDLPVEQRYVEALDIARYKNRPGVVALLQKHRDELMHQCNQTKIQEVLVDED